MTTRTAGILTTLIATVIATLLGSAIPAHAAPGTPGRPGTTPPAARRGSTSCVNAPDGWLAEERAAWAGDVLPRLPQGRFSGPAGVYLGTSALRCGDSLEIHLGSSTTRRVVLDVLRVGDYRRGKEARLVWRSPPLVAVRTRDVPASGIDTARAAWPVRARIPVTPAWRPGMYLVRTTPLDRPNSPSYQPFWVGATTPARRPALVVVASTLTDLAYNRYGGRSLYFGRGSTPARVKADVAYRAWAARPMSDHGMVHVLTIDAPFARLMDRVGATPDWITDDVLDADPGVLGSYTGVVIPGHSEYWTWRMYDGLEAAVARGANVAVLGANALYWQTRVGRDVQGRLESMTVYRDPALDPVRDRRLTTTLWELPLVGRDPARWLGVHTTGVGVTASPVVQDPPAWLIQGTGLRRGMRIVSGVGNEADGVVPGVSPTNTQVALVSTAPSGQLMTTTYRSAPSGAGLFAAGTTYWACLAVNRCGPMVSPPATQRALTLMTRNVVTALSVPRWGRSHPSVGSDIVRRAPRR